MRDIYFTSGDCQDGGHIKTVLRQKLKQNRMYQLNKNDNHKCKLSEDLIKIIKHAA